MLDGRFRLVQHQTDRAFTGQIHYSEGIRMPGGTQKPAIDLYWQQLHRLFDRFKDSPSSACPWGGAEEYRHLGARRSKQLEEVKHNKDTKADYRHEESISHDVEHRFTHHRRHEGHHKFRR